MCKLANPDNVDCSGSPAPPIICGYNTGQHMCVGDISTISVQYLYLETSNYLVCICNNCLNMSRYVESSEHCNKIVFTLGLGRQTTATRWGTRACVTCHVS